MQPVVGGWGDFKRARCSYRWFVAGQKAERIEFQGGSRKGDGITEVRKARKRVGERVLLL